MFPNGWIVWYFLMSAPVVLCSLDIIENGSRVTCSQGLLGCFMKDGSPFELKSFKITNLRPEVKLCCSGHTCALCLLINMKVDLDEPGEVEEGNSGLADDGDTDETKNNAAETGSVTVCYKTPKALPTCKKVEFLVNQAWTSQESSANISIIITNAVISYGNLVFINSPIVPEIIKEVNVPSLKDVCSSDTNTYVQECNVPKVSISMNKAQQVELHFEGSNSSAPVVCLQNEMDGTCQIWDRNPIPLESVTPCTCFQAWKEAGATVRSRICPFKNNSTLRLNTWKNLAVSVKSGSFLNETRLWWNMSSPCRLKGEVWACERTPGPSVCTEKKGFGQQMEKLSWRQNSKGLWEQSGVFAQINLKNHPCVMIIIKEMEVQTELGPFCYNNINRWRWSLFAVTVMLLFSLSLLITFFLRDFVKKSWWRWRCGGFFKTGHKTHVLVLSPPDSNGEASAAVNSLGSLLCAKNFIVTVDQWSRKRQFSWGPLPWSHCQLLSMDSQCERVVLVLTPTAIENARTWSGQGSPVIGLQEECPYSDIFRASLFAIQAHKNQGRANERFVLITFDSLWTGAKVCHNKLPEILQGLPFFHLPSQINSLLSDLYVGRTRRQLDRGRWTLHFSRKKHKNQDTLKEPETKPLQQM